MFENSVERNVVGAGTYCATQNIPAVANTGQNKSPLLDALNISGLHPSFFIDLD